MAPSDSATAPIPGESTLLLNVMLVCAALAGLGLIAALIFDAGAPLAWALAVMLTLSIVGVAVQVRVRARYLARVRNGDVIDREPWSSLDQPYSA